MTTARSAAPSSPTAIASLLARIGNPFLRHLGNNVRPLDEQQTEAIDIKNELPRLTDYVAAHPQNDYLIDGDCPLIHYACLENVPSLIDACLLNPRAAHQRYETLTPLHALVMSEAHEHPLAIAAVLAAGTDINAQDLMGDTALIRAVQNTGKRYHRGLTQQLLAAGADPNIGNNAGHTPLGEALLYGGTPETAALLTHGADVLHCNNDGMPPLFVANNIDKCKLLIKHGADINQGCHIAASPLIKVLNPHYAKEEWAPLLLRAGASIANLNDHLTPRLAGVFKEAWRQSEAELDPAYKLNSLVTLMCDGGILAPWATEQLSAHSQTRDPVC